MNKKTDDKFYKWEKKLKEMKKLQRILMQKISFFKKKESYKEMMK